MNKLTVTDLWKLEDYAGRREAFRSEVIAHKRNRKLHLGPHLTLLFEDRLTVQYQVQEMLRIERIFERAGIEEELAAYNPLIPDGRNWKATCLIEFEDPAERSRKLVELKGIERRVWLRVGQGEAVRPFADEDLDRENESKTSAVHFLRFELSDAVVAELRSGAVMTAGVDHPQYRQEVTVPQAVRDALLGDLDWRVPVLL